MLYPEEQIKIFEAALDETGMLVSAIDQQHRYQYLNAGYKEWFGLDPSACVGKHISEIIGERSYKLVLERIEAAFRGEYQEFESQVPYQYGGGRWVVVKFIPQKCDGAIVQRILVVSRDISDLHQKKTDRQVLEDTIAEGVVLVDATGKAVSFNDAALNILSLSEDQLTGRSALDSGWQAIREDGTSFPLMEHPSIRSLMTGREIRNQVMGIHLPTGALKWLQISSSAFYFKDPVQSPLPGVPENRRVISAFVDITDVINSKRAFIKVHKDFVTILQSSQDSSNLLAHVVEEAPIGIVTITRSGILSSINSFLARSLLGYEISELMGHSIFDLAKFAPELPSEELLNNMFENKDAVTEVERIYPHRDGTIVYFKVKYIVLKSEFSESPVILAVCENITSQKKLEAALIEARDMAISKSAARSQFIANVSHEIRTPLNGVLANLDLLASSSKLDRESSAQLGDAIQSGQTLLSLLNDILDFTKIDAGYLNLESCSFNPTELLKAVFDSFKTQFSERGLEFDFQVIEQLPDFLLGDQLRLKQILNNLLSNAVKFTHHGKVSFECIYQAGQLWMTVSDTGIGMDESQTKKVFDAFVQADDSTSRQYGGTGLGLAIVRHLVHLMSGQIHVSSKPGVGSVFKVVLPLEEMRQEPAARLHTESKLDIAICKKLHVLLAEDNIVNQKVMVRILHKLGHQVTVASNGKEAVDLAAQLKFDVILMDCQMPVIDGYEATKLIRDFPMNASTAIIAVTANAFEEDRDRCMASGMNAYLTKPVMSDQIKEILFKFCQ